MWFLLIINRDKTINIFFWPLPSPPLLSLSLNENGIIGSQSSGKTLQRTFNIRIFYTDWGRLTVVFCCLKCIIVMMSFCQMKYDSILRKILCFFFYWVLRYLTGEWGGEHFPGMNGEYEWFILSVELFVPVSPWQRVNINNINQILTPQ